MSAMPGASMCVPPARNEARRAAVAVRDIVAVARINPPGNGLEFLVNVFVARATVGRTRRSALSSCSRQHLIVLGTHRCCHSPSHSDLPPSGTASYSSLGLLLQNSSAMEEVD